MCINSSDVVMGSNFKVFGTAIMCNIYTAGPYAVPNNVMAYGSLTIGGTLANYCGSSR